MWLNMHGSIVVYLKYLQAVTVCNIQDAPLKQLQFVIYKKLLLRI